MQPRPGSPAGIYVHIPFCAQLCPYCDFAVAVRRTIPHEEYADSVIRELAARQADGELEGRNVSSVYFGGGTPTMLALEQVARIVDRIRALGVDPAEWTFEANPVDLSRDVARGWSDLGFSRVSLGVQSFDDDYLERLGRKHDGTIAKAAIGRAHEVGLDTSIDLIFGGPQHDEALWQRDLEVLTALPRLDHVSAYHLTVEPGTVFSRRLEAGDLELPDDDVAVSMLESLRQACSSRGVEQYEVSSYAAEGRRSVHNSHYWQGSEYLGIGVGAHGLKIDGEVVRTSNSRRLAEYMKAPVSSRNSEVVSPSVHVAERLFTGLRSAHGVDLHELAGQCAQEEWHRALEKGRIALQRVVEQGWATVENEVFRPTRSGYLFADLAGSWVFDEIVD